MLQIEFVASKHQRNFSRSVYSILDYLGDVGGLLDALKLIASALIAPFSGYSYITVLLTKLFSVQLSRATAHDFGSADVS